MIKRYLNRQHVTTTCLRHDGEQVVLNGLAITPSKMMELTKQGIPITPQANITYEELDGQGTHDVPLDLSRGIDMADLWEASMEGKRKLRDAVRTGKGIYLDNGKGVDNAV